MWGVGFNAQGLGGLGRLVIIHVAFQLGLQ